MATPGFSTIRIALETKAMLEEMGRKGDSFDDIIRRVITERQKKE